MKRLIFLLWLYVAITTVVESWIDDASERVASKYKSSKDDMKNCMIETNITFVDVEVMPQILEGEDTTDKEDSALRIGCLFACAFKKRQWYLNGTRILNVEQLKRELDPEELDPEKHNEILDTCNNTIQNLTNECEVMLNFTRCITSKKIAELGPWLDDASEKVAIKFLLTKANAKNCFIETKITLIEWYAPQCTKTKGRTES